MELGLHALAKYIALRVAERAEKQSLEELRDKLPLSVEEINDHWYRVHAVILNDKNIYLEIVDGLGIESPPELLGILRPFDGVDTQFSGIPMILEELKKRYEYEARDRCVFRNETDLTKTIVEGEELRWFLMGLVDKHSIRVEEDEIIRHRHRAKQHWKGLKNPLGPELIRLGPTHVGILGAFIAVALEMGSTEDVDFGIALNEPVVREEKLDGMDMVEYWKVNETNVWIATMEGIKTFVTYVEYKKCLHTLEICTKYFITKFPLSCQEVVDHWDKVHAETVKSKELYLEILTNAAVKMNPIVATVLKPIDDREDLAFPGLMKAIERLEEEAGHKFNTEK